MASFRSIIILGGLACIALLWGSYLSLYEQWRLQPASVQLFFWSIIIGITFLIVIRVWDAWYQHLGRDARDKRRPNDPRDERDRRRPGDPRDVIDAAERPR